MIIPVLDLKNNECVTGKSGNRSTYTKLKSVYGDNPYKIANNLKKEGYERVYIADLDKIKCQDNTTNVELIKKINSIIPVMLDNGIKNIQDIQNNSNISTYDILATETMDNLDNIYEIIEKSYNNNYYISVDIKNNELLIQNKQIKIDDIISLINNTNIKNVIILNISQVGTKRSNQTSLQEYVINNLNDVDITLAGGLTNDAIDRYKKRNINNFLVGTILHEGTLEK